MHFQLLGIPVRIHPFFWVIAVFMGIQGDNNAPARILIWVGAVFLSILVHEMGHALMARYYGWPPRITLYGFGGLATYSPTHHDSRSRIIILVAGPGAGFLLIALVLAIVNATGHHVTFTKSLLFPFLFEPYGNNLDTLILNLLFVNIFWGLVNLLPVYPLDGGQIARELMMQNNPHEGMKQSLWLSVITGAGIAIFGAFQLGSPFMAVFFGYMAYSSYSMLQMFSSGGPGFGGPRW
ncbi:MAG: site-2 protease family protein [Pirellulales bacterium]